jgi:hypothetical protein
VAQVFGTHVPVPLLQNGFSGSMQSSSSMHFIFGVDDEDGDGKFGTDDDDRDGELDTDDDGELGSDDDDGDGELGNDDDDGEGNRGTDEDEDGWHPTNGSQSPSHC